MITTRLACKPFWDNDFEGYIFLLVKNFSFTKELQDVQKYYPLLEKILVRHKFTGDYGQSFEITTQVNGRLVQFLFFGLGELNRSWDEELERLRRVVGNVVHTLKKREITQAVMRVPEYTQFAVTPCEITKQIAIAAGMAAYEFTIFKTDKKDKKWQATLNLLLTNSDQEVADALQEAEIIVTAINQARNLIDLPGNIAHPNYIATYAQKLADQFGLACTIFGRDKAQELGMGGFCAVDEGSDQEGKFIVLEYKTTHSDAPKIALVGKGVTFDTGGISLKPSTYMTGMKYDMSGAGIILKTMQVLGQLKPQVNVMAVMPMVENMPSGKASRQDDIITFMNGKTAEISNTDAEGRLILADALCYAEQMYAPDLIIDFATLTGACSIALGHYYTALLTTDEKLSAQLQDAGRATGDRVWPLPFHDDFKKADESKVADVSNTGKRAYGAQTITAAWFLRHFVEKTPWVHFDIAGTASDVPDISYLGNSATGSGLRLLVAFLMHYTK